MSGATGRRWTAGVRDEVVAARVRSLVATWGGTYALGKRANFRRSTFDDVLAGRPMRPSTWEKIAAAIEGIEDGVGNPARWQFQERARSTTRPSRTRSRKPLCTSCRKRRVYSAGESACMQCRRAAAVSARSIACVRCGQPHGSLLAAEFCCFLSPPRHLRKPGECAWCADDLAAKLGDDVSKKRDFCDKKCSIAYATDVSGGAFGEAMLDDSVA